MDKLHIIRELYAEDKLILNQFDYSLNEFFGTIQIGLKNIESKSLRVTKNPNNRYVVYDGNKEIAFLDNKKGTVFYDDAAGIFERFANLKRQYKTNPEEKQKLKNILENPNMSFFPIEEIQFTQAELQEVFRTARGRMAGMINNYYKSIFGNTISPIRYKGKEIQINFNGLNDENDFNRILRSEYHNEFIKYGLAIAKFILDGELEKLEDVIDFKSAIVQMIDDEGEANVDETLNGLNVEEIINKYGLSNATEEDAMITRILSMKEKPSSYKIVRINSYSESTQYEKYFTSKKANFYPERDRPSPWCITNSPRMYETYVKEDDPSLGDVYYYILREPDWNETKTIPPEDKRDALDEYSLSMLAVSIKPNGMIYKCTGRYNHGVELKNGETFGKRTDNILNEEELSNLIGKSIFTALPPAKPNDEAKNRLLPTKKLNETLKYSITLLTSPDKESKLVQYQSAYFLLINNSPLKDRRSGKLFKFDNIKKVKDKSGENKGYLLFYTITESNGDKNKFIIGVNNNLKIVVGSKKVVEENADSESIAKTIVFASNQEE